MTYTADDGRTYTLRPRGSCDTCGLTIYDDPTASVSTGLCPCWDEPPRDWFLTPRPTRRDVGRSVVVMQDGQPLRYGVIARHHGPCQPDPFTVALEAGPPVRCRVEDLILTEDPHA